MTTDPKIAEALSVCLPLPRTIHIGDQRWTIAVSAILSGPEGGISVRLLLRGPYGRHRRARLELTERLLLAKAYDPERAVAALIGWLPHSDEDDVLDLAGRDLRLSRDEPDSRQDGG